MSDNINNKRTIKAYERTFIPGFSYKLVLHTWKYVNCAKSLLNLKILFTDREVLFLIFLANYVYISLMYI